VAKDLGVEEMHRPWHIDVALRDGEEVATLVSVAFGSDTDDFMRGFEQGAREGHEKLRRTSAGVRKVDYASGAYAATAPRGCLAVMVLGSDEAAVDRLVSAIF
jgi:hypothetical protein